VKTRDARSNIGTGTTAGGGSFPGLLKELVDAALGSSEAHPAAVALQFLVGLGNAIGRGPRFYVGETPTNESVRPRFRGAALGAIFDAQTHVAQGFTHGLHCSTFLAVSAVLSPQVSPARACAPVEPQSRQVSSLTSCGPCQRRKPSLCAGRSQPMRTKSMGAEPRPS
jgi:hypothetical protein